MNIKRIELVLNVASLVVLVFAIGLLMGSAHPLGSHVGAFGVGIALSYLFVACFRESTQEELEEKLEEIQEELDKIERLRKERESR